MLENKEKLHPFDFALWKSKKEENEPAWSSPWGLGRPGWHIECSTLASIAFGKHIDFHSGGKDLIFPHHHNEMVQCCAFYDLNKWSSFWLHTGHLHLKNDIKMSKSLSNTILINELLSKYTSNQFRLFCLISPYRNDKEFSDEKMVKPITLSNSFSSFLKQCKSYSNEEIRMNKIKLNEEEVFKKLNETKSKVHDALCDDFNTCLVIDELFQFVNFMNKIFQSSSSVLDNEETNEHNFNRHYGCVMVSYKYIKYILDLFGLDFDQEKLVSNSSMVKTDSIIEASLKFRSLIRNLALDKDNQITKELKNKIFKYSDRFRQDLNDANIEFKDHKNETIWKIKQ